MTLTPRMLEALRAVHAVPIETFIWHRERRAGTEEGPPDGPLPQSLRALQRRGLVVAEHSGKSNRLGHYTAWRITDAGRAALRETQERA